MEEHDRALVDLGRRLLSDGYAFVTPTPATHARVLARPRPVGRSTVVDVLGWSRPFASGELPAWIERGLAAAGALVADGARWRSAVRFSTIEPADATTGRAIVVHSAFPTTATGAVFFGPDTYRFVALLRAALRPCGVLVDVGSGTGAGGLAALDRAATVVLADINPSALRIAEVNVALAGAPPGRVTIRASDILAGVDGPIDAIVANPPYLADPAGRVYRDGGGPLGIDLSIRIVRDALDRLPHGGQLLLYTGSPVVDGRHPLRDAVEPMLTGRARWTFRELDPDVFGEELEREAYRRVERIAVVALDVTVGP
jgi:methylase of polypeptide subunit release factors